MSAAALALLLACASSHDSPRESPPTPANCPGPDTVRGVDVSHWQGNVDWPRVKGTGIGFAFARVTHGLEIQDTSFARNWPALRSAGLIRGAYHYFRPAQDPLAQADLALQLLDAAGGLQPGDLPLVLDVETSDGLTPGALQAAMRTWLARVEARTGRKPIIYCSPSMSTALGSGFGDHPLWLAHWYVSCPTIPDGWSRWRFWQHSSTGTVAGIQGAVDLDLWNGTLAELQTFAAGP